jgi:hypothetical protein
MTPEDKAREDKAFESVYQMQKLYQARRHHWSWKSIFACYQSHGGMLSWEQFAVCDAKFLPRAPKGSQKV